MGKGKTRNRSLPPTFIERRGSSVGRRGDRVHVHEFLCTVEENSGTHRRPCLGRGVKIDPMEAGSRAYRYYHDIGG